MLTDALKKIVLNATMIKGLTSDALRDLARYEETTTEFGSARYVTKIRSRSAKFTEIAIDGTLTDDQKRVVEEVITFLKGKELICVERTMCDNPDMKIHCKTYYTKDYARIGYMWHNSLFDLSEKHVAEQTVLQVPEWKERKIIVDAKNKVTFILGSDYFGECKKAHLRMAMYVMKQRGGLGLHAGSKLVRVKGDDGKIIEKGVILFGLSGTGKTTLTVHDFGLEDPEGVVIRQDDVVLMDDNGFCYGTEDGFFIKTEGLDEDQTVLYHAATMPHAILENVHVGENGKVDFCDYEFTTNGRGIIRRRDIEQADDSVDLRKANIIIFITRREDIIPPVTKLTPAQGAAAFMLGESIETSAGDPSKAGQSKRVVGTNPFIIGPPHEEGNQFYKILKENPDMECYLLNTGTVGNTDKITIKDSAAIIREIARGRIRWKKCPDWNYLIAEDVPCVDPKKLDPALYFPKKEYASRVDKLRKERKEWLAQFSGLDEEIAGALFRD
ncbi:phosphoenolpyruvate carboxykinase (ATP) [Candidatus Woesearchaeota archaeon CG08_land_8_20_14_0_20_43_7]|nr:MAG: phosphoenolpyruvate carboxykinase (ATP) [Candidatus Woesearchaeota archaeon CG08_land_8_20_14_0_20_43_7]